MAHRIHHRSLSDPVHILSPRQEDPPAFHGLHRIFLLHSAFYPELPFPVSVLQGLWQEPPVLHRRKGSSVRERMPHSLPQNAPYGHEAMPASCSRSGQTASGSLRPSARSAFSVFRSLPAFLPVSYPAPVCFFLSYYSRNRIKKEEIQGRKLA